MISTLLPELELKVSTLITELELIVCTAQPELDLKVSTILLILELTAFVSKKLIVKQRFHSAFPGQRGGSSNAYTASEHTNFHFDIPSEHFDDALTRFVSFFEKPIFREISVQNELEIVQSEHEKNRFNDVWRTNQVMFFGIIFQYFTYLLVCFPLC